MKSISEFLVENKGRGDISFHIPGHKGRAEMYAKAGFGDFLQGILREDVTKVDGADSLFCPTSSIREVMDNYANLYGVKHTELLVNGSSIGIMASVLNCVPRGGKLILARNSHHSAFSALRIGGITPVYISPALNKTYEICTTISPIDVKMACEANPDASAVLITSPTKYGIVSDIRRIADIVHNYGMVLIVDQAHGAHLKFFDAVTGSRMAAEDLGADIVINSIHKTLLSLSGTAILNVCSDRINIDDISESVRMLHTTSPNYLMLGSLDINEKIMRRWGGDMVVAWMNDIRYIYSRLEAMTGVSAIDLDELDKTKVNISLAEAGVSTEQLYKTLRKNGIYPETVHGDYVLLLTGAGNRREDYMEVVKVLREITSDYAISRHEPKQKPVTPDFVLEVGELPTKKELLPLYRAEGRVLFDPIITYPPAAPIACPGEIISMDLLSFITESIERGDKVEGVDEEGRIYVGVNR